MQRCAITDGMVMQLGATALPLVPGMFQLFSSPVPPTPPSTPRSSSMTCCPLRTDRPEQRQRHRPARSHRAADRQPAKWPSGQMDNHRKDGHRPQEGAPAAPRTGAPPRAAAGRRRPGACPLDALDTDRSTATEQPDRRLILGKDQPANYLAKHATRQAAPRTTSRNSSRDMAGIAAT